jgi:serine/threonine-protein kinase
VSWHWPFFLTNGYAWSFYRRLYGVAIFMLLLPVLYGVLNAAHIHIPSVAYGAVLVTLSLRMKSSYVQHGLRQIIEADKQGLSGEPRMMFLSRKGGPSALAGTLAGLLLTIQVFAAMATAIHNRADSAAGTGHGPAAMRFYGALAYSQKDGALSIVADAQTRKHARELALRICQAKAADPDSCAIMVQFKNGCGALARSSNGSFGTGRGRSQEIAVNWAIKVCQKYGGTDCEPEPAVCAPGIIQ